MAQNILKKSSVYHNMKNLWWEQANWQDKFLKQETSIQDHGNTEGAALQFKPFVLKIIDRFGYNCTRCNWM